MMKQKSLDTGLIGSEIETSDLNNGMIQSQIATDEIEPFNENVDPYGAIDNIKCISDWEARKKMYRPENISK